MNGRVKAIIAAIAALVILLAAGGILMLIMNTDKPADYNKYRLGEDMSVEVDDNGDVYLVRRNEAAALPFVMSYTRFSSGETKSSVFIDEKRDMQEAVAYGVELEVNRLMDALGSVMPSRKSRTFLFSTVDYPKIKEVFYYDESTGTEYTLWNK